MAQKNTSTQIIARLFYGPETAQQPLLSQMAREFDVAFDIRNAKMDARQGVVALALEGRPEEVGRAISWLGRHGVTVALEPFME